MLCLLFESIQLCSVLTLTCANSRCGCALRCRWLQRSITCSNHTHTPRRTACSGRPVGSAALAPAHSLLRLQRPRGILPCTGPRHRHMLPAPCKKKSAKRTVAVVRARLRWQRREGSQWWLLTTCSLQEPCDRRKSFVGGRETFDFVFPCRAALRAATSTSAGARCTLVSPGKTAS